jgi:hypothetical protein
MSLARPDETDDAVDEKRLERPRDRIGARFQRLLIGAVMRIGRKGAALSGLEIHHVVADRSTAKR